MSKANIESEKTKNAIWIDKDINSKQFDSIVKELEFVLLNFQIYKCKSVSKSAEDLHINLHYLPSYSPNLNVIERLWRFVKTELRRTAWIDYKSFKENIDLIIDSTAKENKSRMDSLIGEKVQLYDDYVMLNENTFVTSSMTAVEQAA